MIEIVVIGSPIRHGYRRVQVGMSAFVDEATATAFVSGGRAVYRTPPAPVEAAPSEAIAESSEEPQAEAATPAPTEAEALPGEPATSPPAAPADKPKKRDRKR